MTGIFSVIIFISSGFLLSKPAECQQLVTVPLAEADSLDTLTTPEAYIANWLPALNHLGLELATLKLRIAGIQLGEAEKKLRTPPCVQDEVISKNLTDLYDLVNRMISVAGELSTPSGSTNPPTITSVLVQTADVHNLRVNANVAVRVAVETLKNTNQNHACLKNADVGQTSNNTKVDEAIESYWKQVIPIATSVFKVNYGDSVRQQLRQLFAETFEF